MRFERPRSSAPGCRCGSLVFVKFLTSPILLVALATVFVGACTDEDFENAKVHYCNAQRLAREAEQRPGDVELQRQLTDTRAMLDNVLQGASNPDGVRAKLRDVTCP